MTKELARALGQLSKAGRPGGNPCDSAATRWVFQSRSHKPLDAQVLRDCLQALASKFDDIVLLPLIRKDFPSSSCTSEDRTLKCPPAPS